MNMKTVAYDDCEMMMKASITITLFMNVSLKKAFNENL